MSDGAVLHPDSLRKNDQALDIHLDAEGSTIEVLSCSNYNLIMIVNALRSVLIITIYISNFKG